jgi:hypothetical protein
MENNTNDARFPGFAAESCVDESHGHYGHMAKQTDSPEGLSVATFCWDPLRQTWVFC